MIIELEELPKHSLNKIYAGMPWPIRKRNKDNYTRLIKEQCKHVFPKDKEYSVSYDFFFKTRALDVSNCTYMLKMIEDVIFEDDSYKIVKCLNITSQKGDRDYVRIEIYEIK